jgi:hypothetical protein
MRHITRLTFWVLLLGSLSALALAADWGFSGSRPITDADHLMHMQKSMYYMEQWSGTIYFGANHNLNFNLVYSKLTTSGDKGAFRVEYNTPDGKTIEDSQRCDVKFKSDPITLVCGKGIIMGPLDKLKVQFLGDKLPVVIDMTALAPPFRPGSGRLSNPDDAGEFYDFMLMVPRAKVVAKVGDQVLQGNGTVDHSYANVGMHKISKHWMRNTYIDQDLSIIFAANWLPDGRSTGWVSITDKDGNHYASNKVAFSFADTWTDPKKDGYSAPRTISAAATDGSGFKLSVPNMTFKDRKDMLDHLSSVEAFVVRRFSDPMRYNFTGAATVTWPKAGAPVTDTRELTVSVKQLN